MDINLISNSKFILRLLHFIKQKKKKKKNRIVTWHHKSCGMTSPQELLYHIQKDFLVWVSQPWGPTRNISKLDRLWHVSSKLING